MAPTRTASLLRLLFVLMAGAMLVINQARAASHESGSGSGFSIESRNLPIADFITSGNTVEVTVTGPSLRSLMQSTLMLNGHTVRAALLPDPATNSLTGTVRGLSPGINRLQLYEGHPSNRPVAELKVIVATIPLMPCDALLAAGPDSLIAAGISPDSVLTSAVLNADGATSAAGVTLPEHCVIRGTLEPRIGIPNDRPYGTMFELRLPTQWNGRFLFQGQGGTGGSVSAATGQAQLPPGNPPPLAAGWAVVTFDGGHEGSDTQFALDPKAKLDFAYHSMDIAALAAKALINAFYGRKPDHSYFSGSSNGGRQAMMFTQRFPTYFDGVIAGSATYRLSATYADSPWLLQQLNSIAPLDASGQPIMSQAFSNDDLTLLANDILAVCDSRDGVIDGMVLNTNACNFSDYDPARLKCAGAKTPDCLTGPQVTVMRRIQGGARDSNGKQLYNTWPWDPGIGGTQWRQWKLGTSLTTTPNSIKYSFCSTSVGYLYLTPPEPDFNCLTFNFDVDPARLHENSWLDADNPDLAAFHKHGGKILWYHGTADPSTPYTEIVRYLDRMTSKTTHSDARTAEFARLFVVPGLGHTSGGAGLDRFDPLSPMVNWVENGVPPKVMVVSGTNFPGRTRPLCVYPMTARYRGIGNIEDASSFVCTRAAYGKHHPKH